jgi:phage protein D
MGLPGSPADLSAHVTPTITINSTELSDTQKGKLVRTVVTTHLHLPDMFEIKIEDSDNTVADLNVKIGSLVEVWAGAASDTSAKCLIKGEVTAIEGDYHEAVFNTVIRGYEKAHRLQRASRTRTFVDMKDSDIASKIAKDAGLTDTKVDASKTTHKHISQIAQTDWDFLKFRAQEIGYEVGVAEGKFFFRKPSGSESDGGGLGGAVAGAAASLAGGGPTTLTFQENMISFQPRVSAGGQVSDIEVRVWDPDTAKVVVGASKAKTGTATLDKAPKPGEMAGMFTGLPIALPSLPQIPGLPDLGLPASQTAHLVVDRPVDRGGAASAAAEEMAKGVAEHIASTFAEADGLAYGNPAIQAGQSVKVEGVPEIFKGTWIVTEARHIFNPAEGGYHTAFVVSGRQDRTLLGLCSTGRTNGSRPVLNGFVCGVVTNIHDPDTYGRVKVAFPWLDPSYESDWARVVQLGMGKKSGMLFTPGVGDEVLVGFEFGDARRPYVVGGLINGKNGHDLLSTAVAGSGPMSHVAQSGIVTQTGNRIIFDDDITPPSPMPTKSAITLSDKDGKMVIMIDKKNGQITISADTMAQNAQINIVQKGVGGAVSIKADGNISIEAKAPGKLSLKGGMGVTIDGGPGGVTVSGMPIKLN